MIRQGTINDLSSISRVHTECFPDSFSTALGLKLLEKFYYEYISEIPELFLVCENEEGEIAGFCMGYYMENDHYMKSFISHNRISIGITLLFRLVSMDKRAWKKLKKGKEINWVISNHQYDDIPLDQRGDLLSICVLKKYRGNGYANELISEYQNVLKKYRRKICMLSVAIENSRGLYFYEKNGFEKYREADGLVRTYIKILEE
jgi:ribosomal protein S18 acetylase RimI-like enzyme